MALIALAVITVLEMNGITETHTGTLTTFTTARTGHGWNWVGTVELADGRIGTVRQERLMNEPILYEGQPITVYTVMDEMALTPFDFQIKARILPVVIVLLLAGVVTIGNARKPKKTVNETRLHPSSRH